MQRVEARGLARVAVECRHRRLDRGSRLGARAREAREPPLADLLLERALGDARSLAHASPWQPHERLADRAQALRMVRELAARLLEHPHGRVENARVFAGIDRKPVREVIH